MKYTTDKQLSINKKDLKVQFNMALQPTKGKALTVAVAQRTGKKKRSKKGVVYRCEDFIKLIINLIIFFRSI